MSGPGLRPPFNLSTRVVGRSFPFFEFLPSMHVNKFELGILYNHDFRIYIASETSLNCANPQASLLYRISSIFNVRKCDSTSRHLC